ncbi:MAG: Stf0 sulfotransferase family protein [Verrucomicrobiota bacterium]|nr:Stf0 sulfotransferase family protein [Verrucomicrobiota bacterium]
MSGIFHHWRHPRRCYVICGIARSGSNLLSDGLRETGRAGRPNQFFYSEFESFFRERQKLPADIAFLDYLRAVIKSTATSNEVFGFKLMAYYLHDFLARLRATNAFGGTETSDLVLLQNAFPRLQFIRIWRRNKLRQAISKARATQTGLWKVQPGKNEVGQEQFDRDLIAGSLRTAEEQEKIWKEFFARNQIEPFVVEYEELSRDYEANIRAVLKFLRIARPRGKKISAPVTKKQSDAISAEWERLYNESNMT